MSFLILANSGTIIPNMSIITANTSNPLFSKVQQHVLGLLYCQPNIDFHTNEIIRLTKLGTGVVQRELVKLASAGILTVKQLGNQKRYQANQANPFFEELRGLVLKTFGLADIIKEGITPVSDKIIVSFIYGSLAKQNDTAKSDIDLMIISEQLTYAEIFKLLAHAEEQLNRKINPVFYMLAEWTRKKNEQNNFIVQVLIQPKIFLIGTEQGLNILG
jgi:predicted nucleotidyltransferase